ncbi:tol-pal system protein YbgF [Litchfieldella rifensis]|uniref:Cell division coordinator CpoB n=1 Tax=Litchfieldella rifensis TaxID=762643 RepID=A0ABV7LSG9_9GAMM
MKRSLKGLCGAGALVLPLSVWAAPVVEDLTAQPRSFYEQTEAREEAGGNLILFNQLQENQQEIQQLRGQLEELRYQVEQLRRLSQERYLDLEERFMAGGGGGGLGGRPSPDSQVDADVARDVATAPSGPGNPTADAQATYQQAFQHVQDRNFPAAIQAFEAFVNNYPDTTLTANGYYWLGELYSAQSDLEPAARAFERVINDYPQSSKVPDSLYKLGLLRARQGQPDASRELLTRVRNDYPESSAAGLANDFLNQSGF